MFALRAAYFWACLALTGCSMMGSERPEALLDRHARTEGVLYSLPRGILTATLSEQDANVTLEISGPSWEPDVHHRYLLQHRPLPNYEDTIDVAVNKKGFLKSVKTVSDDKTAEILLNVIKAAAQVNALRSEKGGEKLTLAQLTFDPAQPDEVARTNHALHRVLTGFLDRKIASCQTNASLAAGASNRVARATRALAQLEAKTAVEVIKQTATEELTTAKTEATEASQLVSLSARTLCSEYQRLVTLERRHGFRLAEIKVDASAPVMPAKPADCSIGLCYRVNNPYRISSTVAGSSVTQASVDLPNGNPPIAIDIERAFFVKKVKDITFDETDGSLSTVKIVKPSELLEISKFPLQVITAVLSAPAEAFKLRAELYSSQKTDVSNRADLAQAIQKSHGEAIKRESSGAQLLSTTSSGFSPPVTAVRTSTPPPSNPPGPQARAQEAAPDAPPDQKAKGL
jgi:hypothetical protein